MMGGEAAISRALASTGNGEGAGSLTLRLDPSDLALRPLRSARRSAGEGEARATALFKLPGEGAREAGELERVGEISETHTFGGLADFYHPCKASQTQESSNILEGLGAILEGDGSKQAAARGGKLPPSEVDILPPSFSRWDAPLNFFDHIKAKAGREGKPGSGDRDVNTNDNKDNSKRSLASLLPPETQAVIKQAMSKPSQLKKNRKETQAPPQDTPPSAK